MPRLTGFSPTPLPGPNPVPLIGHLPRVLQFVQDPIQVMGELQALGDVVSVCRDNPALVCVFGAERNREVLGNPTDFRHDEEMFVGPEGSSIGTLGQMITCINGDRHQRHRRLLAPAFTKSNLAGYAGQIVDIAESVAARLPRDQAFDLDRKVTELALLVAVRTLFGVDVLGGESRLAHLAVDFAEKVTKPAAMLLPYDLPGSPYRTASRAGDALLAALGELVTARRAGGGAGHDTLSLLLQAVDEDGSGFSDAELMPELIGLFFAGYETTAKTLDWTLYLLDRHPTVLAGVLDELEATLGGRRVTPEDLPRLSRLDHVVKEAMRLLPPMPLLFLRVAGREVTLGGHTLPPGANVAVSPFMTQRDPIVYPDPRRFLPERWETIEPSVFEYLPFGAGPRVCIGAGFARQSLRLLLATLLQRVGLRLEAGSRVDYQVRAISLVPKSGLWARAADPGGPVAPAASITGNMPRIVDLPS